MPAVTKMDKAVLAVKIKIKDQQLLAAVEIFDQIEHDVMLNQNLREYFDHLKNKKHDAFTEFYKRPITKPEST